MLDTNGLVIFYNTEKELNILKTIKENCESTAYNWANFTSQNKNKYNNDLIKQLGENLYTSIISIIIHNGIPLDNLIYQDLTKIEDILISRTWDILTLIEKHKIKFNTKNYNTFYILFDEKSY